MSKRVYLFLLFLLLFIDEKFFFITQGLDWRYSMVFLSAFFFVYVKKTRKVNYSFKPFINLYVLMLIISAFMVFYRGVSPVDTIIRSYMLLLPILLYVPMTNIGVRFGTNSLLNLMVSFSKLVSLILLFQSLGIINVINSDVLSTRNDSMRSFIGTYAMMLGAIILFYSVLFEKQKKKWQLFIWIALNIICIFYVNQSRSTIFALIGAFALLLYFKYSQLIKKTGVIGNALKILAIVFVVYYSYSLVNNIVNLSISSGEASSLIRLEAYRYYFSKFLSYPILGVGFSNVNSLINDGIVNKLYVDDIGIVGYIAQTGLMGIFVVVVFVKQYLAGIKQLSSNHYKLFSSIGLMIVLLLPFNSLLSTDSSIIYVVFILSSLTASIHNERIYSSY